MQNQIALRHKLDAPGRPKKKETLTQPGPPKSYRANPQNHSPLPAPLGLKGRPPGQFTSKTLNVTPQPFNPMKVHLSLGSKNHTHTRWLKRKKKKKKGQKNAPAKPPNRKKNKDNLRPAYSPIFFFFYLLSTTTESTSLAGPPTPPQNKCLYTYIFQSTHTCPRGRITPLPPPERKAEKAISSTAAKKPE